MKEAADRIEWLEQRLRETAGECVQANDRIEALEATDFFARHHMTPDEVVTLMMHWQARALKAETGIEALETALRDIFCMV